MTALQKHDEQSTEIATVQDMSGGILAVIERAARDPNIDIEKMERLFGLAERMQDRQAAAAYSAALSDMQPQLPVIEEHGGIKNREGVVQSTYALWEDVNEAIRPILALHGFALSFKVRTDAHSITVTGILSHRQGHSEQTELTLPSDTSGSKNTVQAIGSSASYGKRYTAYALLNITSRGDDDDGKKGGAHNKRTDGTKVTDLPEPRLHRTKTELKQASRDFARELESAADSAGLEAMIDENGPLLAQLRRDLPDFWKAHSDRVAELRASMAF